MLLLILVCFVLLVSSLFAILPGIALHSSAASSQSGFWLKHSVRFNTAGQFEVNESLFELSNATQSLSSVTFSAPSAYAGHVVAVSAYTKVGSAKHISSVSQSQSGNNTLFSVSLSPSLSPGENATVNLGYYVVGTFQPRNSSNYNVPILMYPSVNLNVGKIVSSIFLPYLTTHVADGTPLRRAGFSQTVNGSAEIWDLTTTNTSITNPAVAITNVYSDPTTSGSLDFSLVQRQLSVDSTGNIIVKDTITVKNLGSNNLAKLNYLPLTNSTSVTLLPSSQTLLSNVKSVSVLNGQLDLGSISGSLQGGSVETIILQYPLGSQYWSVSGGVYNLNITANAPVNAIVDEFQLSMQTTPGVIVTNQGNLGTSAVEYNTTGFSTPSIISYRIGVGSSFGVALPLGVMLFLAVLVSALIFRPRKAADEGAMGDFDALIRLVEDKVSGTNDILSELKGKGSAVNRNDLVTARVRIDELRTKSASRIGSLRSQLSSPGVTVQSGLNQIVTNDREYDRAVRDILNNYDQLISKRMREETFARVLQNSDRRLQQITNNYIDSVHDLREEYESEA